MKKIFLIFGIILIVGGGLFFWYLFTCEDDWCYLFDWQKSRRISNFNECAQAGYPILESYPRQCRPPGGQTFVENIVAEQKPNIVVFSPKPNDEIGLPLRIEGEARVFENNFLYRLKDADGSVLVYNFSTALAPDTGFFGPFSAQANYPEPKGQNGTLEVFSGSPKDGSEINMVSIPVRFRPVDSLKVKVFFGNRLTDLDSLYCEKTYPIERRIPKTKETAKAALLELLSGPTINEGERGVATAINSGVKLKSIIVKNSTAYVDFDEMLGVGVAGSCRVLAIRSEITDTLKQFPMIQNVVISINSQSEGILEP